jgi:phosphoenolpyruvate synthase/pyruvate phosphate dikinase
MPHYIRWFEELRIEDVPLVGGKNASLGEMYRELTSQGLRMPNGLAVTAEAFRVALTEAVGSDIRSMVRASRGESLLNRSPPRRPA